MFILAAISHSIFCSVHSLFKLIRMRPKIRALGFLQMSSSQVLTLNAFDYLGIWLANPNLMRFSETRDTFENI